jgi:hypothetical protein
MVQGKGRPSTFQDSCVLALRGDYKVDISRRESATRSGLVSFLTRTFVSGVICFSRYVLERGGKDKRSKGLEPTKEVPYKLIISLP